MKTISAKDKIIVALDVEDLPSALKLVELLHDDVGAFKIGKQLFTSTGPDAVRSIHGLGGRVFLDLKFHDIPTTVAKASVEAARHGVFMFNMHALGGSAMMREAVRAVRSEPGMQQPLMIAVTVLTSMGPGDLQPLGITLPVDELVARLALLAKEAGMSGVVASPREIGLIKKACGPEFIVVTPGIRPAGSDANDQKRAMTPAEAVQAGADFIVVGRPITHAPDPEAAARSIAEQIAAA
ncbi:MAG: orotidine-5'-phosphate decarboxylase [Deltaproteobacteria bacterium]|nr:orotidine-5'-phosphate decarboxylase [Deltaproteobacteria bacterium]